MHWKERNGITGENEKKWESGKNNKKEVNGGK